MSSPAQSAFPNLGRIPLHRVGTLIASSRGQAVAAWAVWAVLSLAGLWFVAAYGLTMPYWDEWAWVPVVTGHQPVSLQWLWAQHNEHRMVLPRLIYLGLGSLSGFDFRAGSLFNVLALSGLAMGMMLAARRLRGRTSLCDAFFPLALLHWGHIFNLVWGFQLNFVTSTVLAGIILIQVARCGRQLSPASALLVTGCLVGLGLCGTFGLAYLPAMACWLGFAAIARWREGGPRAARRALAMGALSAMPIVLVGVYFLGYTRPGHHAASPGILASLRTGLEFLSSGIGLAAKEVWPVSGLLVAAVGSLSVWQVCRVFRDRAPERVRAAGFFCFLTGIGSLALGIGWGRAFLGSSAGFMSRYVTLAALLFCLFYLLCEACGTAALGRHVRRSLFVLMCVLVLVNARKGLRDAAEMRTDLAGFREDALAGMPAHCLAARYGEQLGCEPEEVLSEHLQRLRERGLGLYRGRTESDRLDALRVERIGNVAASARATDRVRLSAGEAFAQRFDVEGDAAIGRIDVRIGKARRCPLPHRLEWVLNEITPAGARVLLAGNEADLDRPTSYPSATLTFPSVRFEGRKRLELVLRVPADEPGGATVEIPVYPCAPKGAARSGDGSPDAGSETSLLGFLFVTGSREPRGEVAGHPRALR